MRSVARDRVRAAGRALVGLTLAIGSTASIGGAASPARPGSGALEIEVRYAGAPVVEKVKVNRDVERCGTEMAVEKVVVGPGRGLAHALVTVGGLRGVPVADAVKSAETVRPLMEQKGCRFVPHVLAMPPGEVDFRNTDEILHSVHSYATANPSINRVLPKFKKVLTERLDKPEIVKVTCDVHPWMVAWIAVVPHPWVAVTDESGRARIEQVPAGRRTVEVWHEVLGRQTKDVEVRAGQTVRLEIDVPKR
jgi:plastocyanin